MPTSQHDAMYLPCLVCHQDSANSLLFSRVQQHVVPGVVLHRLYNKAHLHHAWMLPCVDSAVISHG